MSAWFVTGTDTDVGKTTVSVALLMAARHRQISAVGYKPIETGCTQRGDALVGPDTLRLAKAAGQPPQCSYSYQPPVAPAHAAFLDKTVISLKRISEHSKSLIANHEFTLVEGAGGLLVPLSPSSTILDLAKSCQLPLLLVAANRLGTINHTLLSLQVARQNQLQVDAVILSDLNPTQQDDLGNETQIHEHGQVQVLRFPFCNTDEQLKNAGLNLLKALL